MKFSLNSKVNMNLESLVARGFNVPCILVQSGWHFSYGQECSHYAEYLCHGAFENVLVGFERWEEFY
jgi:hypothetical protein